MKIKYINKQIQRDKEEQLDDELVAIVSSLNNTALNAPGYVRLNKCPEVITAIDKIADLISNMTIYLMENTDNGDVRVINGLSRKIDINPCSNMTRKQWMFFIVRTLLLDGDGNAVILPVYEENGESDFIRDLLPVPAKDFSINLGGNFKDSYTIQIGNKKYKPEDLIHFVINPTPDSPYKGHSYRIPLRELVATLDNGETIKQEFMKNRYLPSMIVALDSDISDLLNEERKDRITKKIVNSVGAGEPWILPSEIASVDQVKPLSLKDIAITETLAQDKKMIAGLLGVPAFILGEGEFNREEYNTFIQDKILSIAKVIEQTLTQKLLISPNLYFKFNLRSLYSYDLGTLSTVGGQLFDRGIMTGNEVRDWMSLSPAEGLDSHVALENYIPVELLGNQKKLDQQGEKEDEGT